jgi:hypothetical protein
MPYGPIILLLRDTVAIGSLTPSRPACELIEGIKGGRRTSLEARRAVGIAERTEIEKHRHALDSNIKCNG